MKIRLIKKTLFRQVLSLTIFASIVGLTAGSISAGEYLPGILSPSFVDEVRIGVQYHDLHIAGTRDEDGVDINAEILFRRPNFFAQNNYLAFLINPRPHIGGHLNTAGDTSQVYAGLTWDYRLTEKFFVEGSFGGSYHTGETTLNIAGQTRPLGCRVIFRESISAGYELSQKVRVMITFDHINNFNLCNDNAGLSTIGARLGYKF